MPIRATLHPCFTGLRNDALKLIQRRCRPDRVNLQQIEALMEFGAITTVGPTSGVDDATLFVIDPELYSVLREMNQRSADAEDR